MTEQQRGYVKWYNPDKGFGFIVPDNAGNGGKDIFVHVSALEKSGLRDLKEGESVFFDTEEHRGKLQAANIKKAA